jgi:hypothetical protein
MPPIAVEVTSAVLLIERSADGVVDVGCCTKIVACALFEEFESVVLADTVAVFVIVELASRAASA